MRGMGGMSTAAAKVERRVDAKENIPLLLSAVPLEL